MLTGSCFADCALVVEPDAFELADIALNSARSALAFLDEAPRVAMLSFSTAGSAAHPRAETVRKAADIARRSWPELEIEGEIQFDAAIDAAIRARKAPHSRLRNTPNVFVFPGLDSANIGYKIAQRVGGMAAVGPVLQGLAKPANDLSRGCYSRGYPVPDCRDIGAGSFGRLRAALSRRTDSTRPGVAGSVRNRGQPGLRGAFSLTSWATPSITPPSSGLPGYQDCAAACEARACAPQPDQNIADIRETKAKIRQHL